MKLLQFIYFCIFSFFDFLLPKNPRYWLFPVCFLDQNISCNLRGVFEEIKNDASIKKIVLLRGKKIKLSGINVCYAKLYSFKGIWLLLRSKVVLLKHSSKANIGHNLGNDKRYIINLWHGIPLKKIGILMTNKNKSIRRIYRENKSNSIVISSSKIDKMAITLSFSPIPYNNVHITGLPRNDFILRDKSILPQDMKTELEEIKTLKGEKKLIFYAPTFRDGQDKSIYQFSNDDIIGLEKILENNNAVLGIREHMASNTSNSFLKQLSELQPIDLNKFTNIEMIYRHADVLITDYSSCFFDFMLTDKPVVSFAYDYDRYKNEERGFFYDIKTVFPNKINTNFREMLESLENSLVENNSSQHYKNCKNMFHAFQDSNSSKRVVEIVKKKINL